MFFFTLAIHLKPSYFGFKVFPIEYGDFPRNRPVTSRYPQEIPRQKNGKNQMQNPQENQENTQGQGDLMFDSNDFPFSKRINCSFSQPRSRMFPTASMGLVYSPTNLPKKINQR